MLSNKTALITGASRGIGQAIALEFARQGANVALIYAADAAGAQDTCRQIQALGPRAQAYACDVSDSAQAERTVAQALADFGGLDILVNNAGVTRDNLIPQMSDDDFDRVIAVNLKGAFIMTRQVFRPFMRARRGRIINITSVSGLMGNPGQANYAAAKAGLIGLTKTTARELASRGVTCNAIAPGFVQTDMTRAMGEPALNQALERIPLKRLGQAQDIADAAVFLASDKAAYITGITLKVDGGLYI